VLRACGVAGDISGLDSEASSDVGGATLWNFVVTRLEVRMLELRSLNVKYRYKTKLHGLSPRANYTDRATAACRRSDCQLLRIEVATWSA
jgi:hypothetical protein